MSDHSFAHRLEGKCAIITGGGSGIGRATALRLSAEGAKVLAVGRRQEKLLETVALVEQQGGVAIAMASDASIESDVAAAVAASIRKLGGLDIFFANAFKGLGSVSIFDQTPRQWREILEVNLIGSFLAIKHAGKHMAAQGSGSIVISSSAASLRANAGDAAYSASKAGINNLVAVAANELGGTGVRVNAVLPGLIRTEATQVFFDAAKASGNEHKLGKVNPLRRVGESHEIAALVAFLASDDGSFVNGQCISADGGLSSSHPFGRLPGIG
jgi:NAD(P)-dependent dehydrogenase (short-subunit alcohol dehydrogenase family)